MKKILFLLLLCSFPAFSATIPVDTAVLRGMDKITGRVRELSVSVGSTIDFGELTIAVDKCLTKTPEETPENAAFLHIQQNDKELFSGWMFSSNPALSAMEDPVYDIWVVACVSTKNKSTEPVETSDEVVERIDESEIED